MALLHLLNMNRPCKGDVSRLLHLRKLTSEGLVGVQ